MPGLQGCEPSAGPRSGPGFDLALFGHKRSVQVDTPSAARAMVMKRSSDNQRSLQSLSNCFYKHFQTGTART